MMSGPPQHSLYQDDQGEDVFDEIERLKLENARLRAALQHYACSRANETCDCQEYGEQKASVSCGYVAREALKG